MARLFVYRVFLKILICIRFSGRKLWVVPWTSKYRIFLDPNCLYTKVVCTKNCNAWKTLCTGILCNETIMLSLMQMCLFLTQVQFGQNNVTLTTEKRARPAQLTARIYVCWGSLSPKLCSVGAEERPILFPMGSHGRRGGGGEREK